MTSSCYGSDDSIVRFYPRASMPQLVRLFLY